MSRHTLIHEPTREIVIGFDPPLRAFFGQRFNRSLPLDQDDCVAGWPTRHGLGIQPRIETNTEALAAICGLRDWLVEQGIRWEPATSAVMVLFNEWKETPDEGEPAILAALKGKPVR